MKWKKEITGTLKVMYMTVEFLLPPLILLWLLRAAHSTIPYFPLVPVWLIALIWILAILCWSEKKDKKQQEETTDGT